MLVAAAESATAASTLLLVLGQGEAAPDEYREADLRTPEGWAAALDGRVEVVFHLAGVMSGQAEAEYALGMVRLHTLTGDAG